MIKINQNVIGLIQSGHEVTTIMTNYIEEADDNIPYDNICIYGIKHAQIFFSEDSVQYCRCVYMKSDASLRNIEPTKQVI